MRLTSARLDRMMERIREMKAAQSNQAPRISRVVVHCPLGEPGDPMIGVERLMLAGAGCQPSIYEVTEPAMGDEE